MEEKKSWQLTPEQSERINQMQGKHLYNKFVMQQEDEFVSIMDFIND